MVEFGEGHDVPIELIGIHSRMMNYNATVSKLVDEREDMTPLREHMCRAGASSASDVQLRDGREDRLVEDEDHLLLAHDGLIEELEQKKTELEEEISQPDFYQQNKQQIKSCLENLKDITGKLGSSYERWEELESGKHDGG